MRQKYNQSIGFLKALGIILMVFGHSGICNHEISFIYMFHMPIFFIASGYCFKEKYLFDSKGYLYNKFKGIWWPYVKWSLLFLLFHNVCFYLNIYNDQFGYNGRVSHLYTTTEFLKHIATIILKLQGHEGLLGGYWFMNALFWGSLIVWPIIRYIKKPIFGGAFLIILCTLLNSTCYYLPLLGISSRAFAAALLIFIGYMFAKYKVRIFNYWQILLSFLLTLFGSFVWNMAIGQDFYENKRFMPYIMTAVLATWSIYSLFERMKISNGIFAKLLAFVGKHTLTILTWHFLSFKLVSFIIIEIYDLPIERLAEFPVIIEYSMQGWWLAYFLIAIAACCGIAYCNILIKKIVNSEKKNNMI